MAMKIIRLIFIVCIISISFFISSIDLFAQVNSKSISVKGYYNKNGTYVQPYHRTAPNSTNRDNYSTKGNINPYTGKKGTVNPDNKSNNYNYPPTSNYYENNNYLQNTGHLYLSGNIGSSVGDDYSQCVFGFSLGYYKRHNKIGYLMEMFTDANTDYANFNLGIIYPTRKLMITMAIGLGDNYVDDYWGTDEYKLNFGFGIDFRISQRISIPIRYETNGQMLLGGIAYNLYL